MLGFIRFGMYVLSNRVMTMLAMVLGSGISLYAAVSPDIYRAIVAVAFWVLAYLPALWSERKSHG